MCVHYVFLFISLTAVLIRKILTQSSLQQPQRACPEADVMLLYATPSYMGALVTVVMISSSRTVIQKICISASDSQTDLNTVIIM